MKSSDVTPMIVPTQTISGTATDSDGQIWLYGTYRIEFYPNPSFPNLSEYFIDGSIPLSSYPTVFTGGLDASGSFTQAGIVNNNRITPTGSMWRFYICPLASSSCGVFQIPVTADANISSIINANITAPRFNANYGSYGYNDAEAQLPPLTPAAWYYNVVLLCLRTYNYQNQLWACSTAAQVVLGIASLGVTFDGGGSVPTTPVVRFITVPFNCIINNWTLICDGPGNCSVDVWFIPSSAPPSNPTVPTSANKISAAAPISLSGTQTKSGDATAISTWTKNLTQWGTLAFSLNSAAFVHTISVQLQCGRI